VCDWDWADDLIYSRKKEPERELPEDILFYFLKKNPMLQVLIDKHELAMEL